MHLKKYFEVGEKVECAVPNQYLMTGEILKVDSHPLEYDRILIRLESVAEQDIRVWISEQYCICRERAVSA